MIDELLHIYEESRLNQGQPESIFNPTLIFNEGWLLRAVLRQWKLAPGKSHLPFLPFPADAKVYSEGQLYSPFAPRQRGDGLAEAHTHADGIVGDFSIGATKSGIEVHPDCRYLAVFEAKLYSPLAGGISHAPGYDQVSRTVGCVINSLLRSGCPGPYAAHVVVLHPADHSNVNPGRYSSAYLERQIAARVEGFGLAHGELAQLAGHSGCCQALVCHLGRGAAEIGSDQLDQFYQQCRRFNRRTPASATDP